jgi:hypothetical protein
VPAEILWVMAGSAQPVNSVMTCKVVQDSAPCPLPGIGLKTFARGEQQGTAKAEASLAGELFCPQLWEKSRARTWHKGCQQSSMLVRHKLTMTVLRTLLLVQPAGTALAQEFPFHFREGLIWVQVDVPQSHEPLNFLLDTGAGVSVLNLRTA